MGTEEVLAERSLVRGDCLHRRKGRGNLAQKMAQVKGCQILTVDSAAAAEAVDDGDVVDDDGGGTGGVELGTAADTGFLKPKIPAPRVVKRGGDVGGANLLCDPLLRGLDSLPTCGGPGSLKGGSRYVQICRCIKEASNI